MSQLVPDDQDVLPIPVGTKVEQALELMRAHDFDQLPVTTAEDRVVGAFTHRSSARGLRHIRPQNNLLTVSVDDRVEELHFVRASQEVGDVLDFLAAIKVQRGVVGLRGLGAVDDSEGTLDGLGSASSWRCGHQLPVSTTPPGPVVQ